MIYKVDYTNKIIFCSSPKAGTTHVKKLYLYYNKLEYDQETFHKTMELPEDYKDYKFVFFIRNPYKRFVSGFVEKGINKKFYNLLNFNILTFTDFVNFIYYNREQLFYKKSDIKIIDYQYNLRHHFFPQINKLDKKLPVNIVFDIEHIDYTYFENIYKIKTLETVISQRGGHDVKYDKDLKEFYYDKPIKDYINIDNLKVPTYEYFFNEDLKNKIYEIYKGDFEEFEKFGFKYDFELL